MSNTTTDEQPTVPTLRAYARLARRAAAAVPGVAAVGGSPLAWLLGGTPGVRARCEDRGRLYLEIDVIAKLGQPMEALGHAVQDAVLLALRGLPGLRPVAIDIIITGIRYDKRGLPKR